jgi:hypothetical protein
MGIAGIRQAVLAGDSDWTIDRIYIDAGLYGLGECL